MNYEDAQCCALMEWATLQSATIPDLKTLFHIPNGGSRNIIEAAKLKRMGVRRGVFDYFLATPRLIEGNLYSGAWLEMKAPKGRLKPEQKDWAQMMNDRGYVVAVCYDWEQARDFILHYLRPVIHTQQALGGRAH